MNPAARRIVRSLVPAVVVFLTAVRPARACSVCFGNENDPLVQGAASGVLFMVIVTYAVLLGLGVTAACWFVRARRMRLNAPPDRD